MKTKELPEEKSMFTEGHFYSPIVELRNVQRYEKKVWSRAQGDEIPGINLRTAEQIQLAKDLSQYYNSLPFQEDKVEGLRYHYKNKYYSYTDAIILATMLLHLKPKRLIEVGSGYSSAVTLDIRDKFFDEKMDVTFVEPFQTRRLTKLINKSDWQNVEIKVEEVQNIDTSIFQELEAGDILFVDTSHVVKTGSELNYILFEILPLLAKGVYIHFHDIFYPFEYPKKWVYEGRNWNECYFLRAFLMNNHEYQIEIFPDYLHQRHPEAFADMPLMRKDTGGCLWMQKL